MPQPWTGELIGRMHNAGVTYEELAKEIGVGKSYISMLLNSKRNPPGAEERLNRAFVAILRKRKEEDN